MRRLLLIPVVLLGLAAGGAFGSAERATASSAFGKISALSASSITVDGRHALTCRLSKRSPKLTGLGVGDRVGVACSHGVLRRIGRIPTGASTSGTVRILGAHSIGVDGERDLKCRLNDNSPRLHEFEVGDKVAIACADGVLVKISSPSAEFEVKTAGGTIGALDASSITIRGERGLTCRLTGDSPISREFKLGDQVGIACVDGVVVKIVRLPQSPEPTTTTATTTGSVLATGEIDELSPTSIAVDGERDVTCRLTDGSPAVTGFKVGDKVKISCANGVLTGIARIEPPATTTTGTTTGEKETPATTDAAGAISALGSATVSVHGEHDLTCSLSQASPKLGDYKLGDKVKIICVGGALSTILRIDSPPTTTGTTTTTTPTVTISATGAITTLGDTTIAVHGERDTSCTIGATSPKLGDYKLGDKVRITCQNGVLAAIVRT